MNAFKEFITFMEFCVSSMRDIMDWSEPVDVEKMLEGVDRFTEAYRQLTQHLLDRNLAQRLEGCAND